MTSPPDTPSMRDPMDEVGEVIRLSQRRTVFRQISNDINLPLRLRTTVSLLRRHFLCSVS